MVNASMRPQHIAAEYIEGIGRLGILEVASMRPQHIAAEYITKTPKGGFYMGLQ